MNEVPLFLRNLDALIGREISPGVTLIAAPLYDLKRDRWTALATVGRALCVIEVNVRAL